MAAPFPSPTQKWHDNTYDSISPTRPELSAKGKNVLITGGGTGIGAQTARSFAQAGAARIGLLGRRIQPLEKTKAEIEGTYPDTKVFVASADVTKKETMDKAFADFAGNGKIDVVVSGAAKGDNMGGIHEVDSGEFLDDVHQNLAGAIYTIKAFLPYAAEDAVAIDINSCAAHANFADKFAAYSVAKLATYRTWDTVAFKYPKMRVYHIQPGVVDTDMNKVVGGVKAMGFEDHVSLPGNFSVWLASPEAVFLKGKYLWANWDVDEMKANAKQIEESTRFNIVLGGWPFSDGPSAGKEGFGSW